MMKHLFCAICIGLLLFPGGSLAQSRRSSKKKKSVSQLQRDLRSLQSRKAALRKELRTNRSATKATLSQLREVDASLIDITGKLEETGEQLSVSKARQEQVADELEDATEKLGESKEQVRIRIKRMYMQGDSTFLSVLVGSGDAGEIASRQFVMQKIAEQDKKVFLNFVALRDRVRDKKSEADKLVRRVANLMDTQRQQQVSLANAKKRKSNYLSDLRARKDQIQDLLRQFEADEASIESQIRAYQRRSGRTSTRYTGGRFAYPVHGRITSNFGMRYHPILKINRLHAGCDFGAPTGTPIYAAASGTVIQATYMRGYGNVVMIDHGGGVSTVYAHCSRLGVHSGQKVGRGQQIANVGSTGLATGPHLHFEVRINGRPVNPRSYL
jgi:murein DD-endopeptidase MepM/ murein hydrolase activator NlpD